MEFVDDTKLHAPADKSDILQDDLNNLMQWAENLELTFNVVECKAIHSGQNNPEHYYIINNKILAPVEEECDLGVVFSEDLGPVVQN